MKVLVIGANNSGKGTLVKLLEEKTDMEVVTCSKLLKENSLDITTGKLLKDELVLHVIDKILPKMKDKDYILDGYPRTLCQDSYLKQYIFVPDLVVVLNISEEEVLERAVGRRVCESCGETYNLNGYKVPKVEGVCDSCSAELYQREDDTEEVVKARYNEYMEKTYPIVTRYKENQGKTVVWEFDTSQSTEEIADTVAEYINYMMY